MDGLTCYTYKQMCDSNAYCASDHRDEMGCDWSGFPGILVALFLLWLLWIGNDYSVLRLLPSLGYSPFDRMCAAMGSGTSRGDLDYSGIELILLVSCLYILKFECISD